MSSKVLVVTDEYCFQLNGCNYVGDIGFTLIKRYLMAFDNVAIVMRTKYVSTISQLENKKNPVNNPKVQIIETPFFQGPNEFAKKYIKIYTTLKHNIPKCDLAILRLPSTTALVVYQIIRKWKMPVAAELVFDCKDAITTADSLYSKIIWTILHHIQSNICKKAIGVACVTEHYMQQHYFSKLPNAITSHYSTIELKPDFFLHPRKFPQKEIITIIHVANQVQFNSRKGHNQLIEVLSHLNKHSKKAHILFVGKDYNNGIVKLTNFAKQLNVQDDISFAGFVNKSRMRELLKNADIAILPTKAEGLPRVVIEAMALGLPCITTPVSGNPELIDKDFLIDYNDIGGIADACKILFENPDIYEYQSKINFEKSQQYSTAILNPRRTEFYKSLISLIPNKPI